MFLTAKRKEYIKQYGWHISFGSIAGTIVFGIIGLLAYMAIKFAKPEAWSDYFNTKFITTTMNLGFVFGGLAAFVILTAGLDALIELWTIRSPEDRKYVTLLALGCIAGATYLCSIGV